MTIEPRAISGCYTYNRMTSTIASIYLTGNNPALGKGVEKCLKKNNLQVEVKKSRDTDYRLLLYDVSYAVENLNKAILDDLDDLENYSGKACLVVISNDLDGYSKVISIKSVIQPFLFDQKNNLR